MRSKGTSDRRGGSICGCDNSTIQETAAHSAFFQSCGMKVNFQTDKCPDTLLVCCGFPNVFFVNAVLCLEYLCNTQ